jgi:hypothetical protein
MARPKKIELPIGANEMLRIALPKKRPEDRMKIFREWARSNLSVKLGRLPSDEESQADFELWCKKQFNSMFFLNDIAAFLRAFVPHFSAANRKRRAHLAATKRWSKKNIALKKQRQKNAETKKT